MAVRDLRWSYTGSDTALTRISITDPHRLHYTRYARHRFHVAGSVQHKSSWAPKVGRHCDRTLHENNNSLGREHVKIDLCYYSFQGYQCTAIVTVDQILIWTAVTVLLLLKTTHWALHFRPLVGDIRCLLSPIVCDILEQSQIVVQKGEELSVLTPGIIYINILNLVPYPINCDSGQIQNLSGGLEDKISPSGLGLWSSGRREMSSRWQLWVRFFWSRGGGGGCRNWRVKRQRTRRVSKRCDCVGSGLECWNLVILKLTEKEKLLD